VTVAERKPRVRATFVERTCATPGCGRVGFDVRIDTDGVARCFDQIGCQGKRYRAAATWRRP
jgi:hypothetical protein